MQILVCLLLLIGFSRSEMIEKCLSNGVCYQLEVAGALSYSEAESACDDKSTLLAIVSEKFVQDALANVSKNIKGQHEYYIGLKYIEKENFVWKNGMFAVPDLLWNDTIPKVKDSACVFIAGNGKMSMGPCSIKRSFICSNNTQHYVPKISNEGYCKAGFFRFLNYCYKLNLQCDDPTYTWAAANDVCHSFNSTLLVIDSLNEQDFVTALMTISPQPAWTGLIHKNISEYISIWIDNSTNTMPRYPIRFKSGEPNGYRTSAEHCLMIYNRLSNIGNFNDEVCNKSLNFICKTEVLQENPDKQAQEESHPLYKRGRCKKDYYEFNETCFYVKNLNKSYQNTTTFCEGRTLQLYNNIHISFIRSLMSHINVNDVWISVFDKDGKVNGAIWLLNETSSIHDVFDNSKCYYMSTRQGLGIAKSCKLTHVATACYYFLEGHEEVTEDLICPTGWLKIGQKCLKFFNDYLTFSESVSKCNSTNSKLVTLNNMKEVQAAESLISGNAWIGIDGESYLRNKWIDGSEIDYCQFRHTTDLRALITKDPKSLCFVLKHKKAEWDDKPCTEHNMLICEMPATKNKCSKDFPIFVDGDCYGNFSVEMTWAEAERFCQRKGGNNSHLASFHSITQEHDVFRQIMDTDEFYIGLKIYDFQKMWVDGSLPNYQRLYVNMNSDEMMFSCFSSKKIVTNSGKVIVTRWNKVNCEIRRKFICKVSNRTQSVVKPDTNYVDPNGFCPQGFLKFKNSCFKIVNKTASWNDANKLCVDMFPGQKSKSTLASFSNKEEFEFILSKMRDFSYYFWIGLYKDGKTGQFAWIDERPLTFINFMDYNYPENVLQGNKTAVYISSHPFKNGNWILISTMMNLPFICRVDPFETSQKESLPTRRCPPSDVEYNNHCYFFNQSPLKYQAAYTSCYKKGYDLLILNDTFEEQFIKYYLSDKIQSDKLIWMGFIIDAATDMMMKWITPKKIPIYYTHFKNVASQDHANLYTDYNPQSKIHGCYSFNLSSDMSIFNEVDRKVINNAMIISHCDITIASVCKKTIKPYKAHNFESVTCAMSRDNISYELDVTMTKNSDSCIRWDIVKTVNTLQYHLETFLYSSVPFNKDGYVSYSLNRCSELKNNHQDIGYSCYIFKDGRYLLEACEMRTCGTSAHMVDVHSSSKTVLILLLSMTIVLIFLAFLFMLRKRILSNYRFRSILAHVLGRYQPDWIGESSRPHTSPGGGVGFSNPVYTPLENNVTLAS